MPRLYRRKARGKKSARLLIRCGDCNNQFEIHYGPDGQDLEIAGVLASIRNWRKILLPLLSKSSAGPSETEYLLRSPANAKRLMAAINASKRGNG